MKNIKSIIKKYSELANNDLISLGGPPAGGGPAPAGLLSSRMVGGKLVTTPVGAQTPSPKITAITPSTLPKNLFKIEEVVPGRKYKGNIDPIQYKKLIEGKTPAQIEAIDSQINRSIREEGQKKLLEYKSDQKILKNISKISAIPITLGDKFLDIATKGKTLAGAGGVIGAISLVYYLLNRSEPSTTTPEAKKIVSQVSSAASAIPNVPDLADANNKINNLISRLTDVKYTIGLDKQPKLDRIISKYKELQNDLKKLSEKPTTDSPSSVATYAQSIKSLENKLLSYHKLTENLAANLAKGKKPLAEEAAIEVLNVITSYMAVISGAKSIARKGK